MSRNLITRGGAAVRAEGLPELQDKIAELINRATAEEVKKIWMQAGLILRDAMRYLAPVAPGPITYYTKGQPPRTVEPGMLKASIFAAYGDPHDQNILVGVNDRMAPHGHWIEYGNVRIPPQPYLRPALTAMRTQCVEAIAEGYKRLLLGDGQVPEPESPDGPVDPPKESEGTARAIQNSLSAKRIAVVRARAADAWARKRR